MKTEEKINEGARNYSRDNPFIYEHNHFSDYFRRIPFVKLKRLLDNNGASLDNKSILIASCGCGIDAHYLKKFYNPKKIYFTDIHMLAAQKTKSNFYDEHFVITDNKDMSFKDNSFDYVFVAASLHHLREPISGIYELLRVSRMGLFVIEPNDSWLTRFFTMLGWASEYEPEHGNYVYRFNKRDIHKISRALFFKYRVIRLFAIHRIAKTKFEFLVLRIMNGVANLLFPGIGNYIIFFINKSEMAELADIKHPSS